MVSERLSCQGQELQERERSLQRVGLDLKYPEGKHEVTRARALSPHVSHCPCQKNAASNLPFAAWVGDGAQTSFSSDPIKAPELF